MVATRLDPPLIEARRHGGDRETADRGFAGPALPSDYSLRVTAAQQTSASSGRDATDSAPLTVLVYSDDRSLRRDVLLAIGTRPAADLPEVEFLECATEPAVIKAADRGRVDLFILDGEAVPAGGMGVARQLKDEIYRCPPIVVLIARPQDAWLATWSRADAVAAQPINAVALADTVSDVLRARSAASTRA